MRGPVGLLLFCSAIAVSADEAPLSLEARSQNHAMIVDVGADNHFKVRVIKLATNETLYSGELIGLPAETTADLRGMHITVRIGPAPYGLTTTAEIEEGEMLADSLHAVWMLTPHRVHLRAEGAMRVGGDVRHPVVVKRVDPIYGEDAKRDRISGIVIVEALVDKTGFVKDAIILKGLPDGLSDAALAAVKQWKFEPATLNGEPVDVIFNVTINFKAP